MSQIRSPLQALVVQWQVQPGDRVNAGDLLVILEAMKMEHEVRAAHAGQVTELFFENGELVGEGELLLNIEQQTYITRGLEANLTISVSNTAETPDCVVSAPCDATPTGPDRAPRADLQRVLERHAFTLDASRPEAQAVAAARHDLSFFQGRVQAWQAPDQNALRDVVPENRLRVYDTLAAMAGLSDEGGLLELRTGFGKGIHTALARIDGRPVGLLANKPLHLGGAMDADAADKAALFI